MTAQYRFVVHFHDNPGSASGFSYTRTSVPVCELVPKSVSLTLSLNKVGQMSLTVNKADISNTWGNYPLSWKNTLVPCTSVWVLRNEIVVWAGYIWDIDFDTDDHTATLACEELIGIYDRIELSTNFSGNGASTAVGSLVQSLLNVQGTETAQMRIVDFSSLVPGTSYLGQHTPYWYEYQKLKVGDLVRQLLGSQGCDWRQAINRYDSSGEWFYGSGSPYFQTQSFGFGAFWGIYGFGPSATFSGSAGRDWETAGNNPIELGTVSGSGSTAAPTPVYPWSQVGFEWGPDTRDNVDSFKVTYSARKTASNVRVGGYGNQGLQLHQRYGMSDTYRLFLPQLYGSWNDPLLTTQTMVDNRAKGIVSVTGLPTVFLTAQVQQPNALASFETIALGDRVRCTIKNECMNWTGKLRIYNITLQLDDRGNEWMLVDLAPDTSAYL